MIDNDQIYGWIGRKVSEIRKAHQMSQEELAGILGLQRTSITNIERGRQKPTLDTLYRFCEHFRLEVGEVVPTLLEVTVAAPQPIVVGGKTQQLGPKTSSALDRLRPISRARNR